MAYGRVDVSDAVLSPLFVASSLVAFGVGTITVSSFDLSAEFTSLGAESISWAFMISVAVLGIAYATNKPSLDKLDEREMGAFVGTLVLVVGVEFVPALADLITGNELVGILAVMVSAAGYFVLSYLG